MKIRIEYEYPPYEFAFCALAMMVYYNDFRLPDVDTVEQYDPAKIKNFAREWMEMHNEPKPAGARAWMTKTVELNKDINYALYSDVYEAVRVKLEQLV